MAITITVVSTTQEFAQLKDRWDQILSRQSDSNIFLEHDWLYTWWTHFGQEGALCILLVYREDTLIAIAPFMKVQRLGITSLEFIASSISDFQGIIGMDGQELDACTALADLCRKGTQASIWRIRRFKANSAMHKALSAVMTNNAGRLHMSIEEHGERAPFLDLSQNWDQLTQGLRPKFVADTSRMEKKLEREQGFRIDDVSGENFSSVIAKIYALSRQNEAQQDMEDGRKVAFLKEIAQKFQARGWLSLKVLWAKDTLAAAHFGFIYRNTYHYYLPAFDSAFRSYGVGRILLKHLIQSSLEQKLQAFDFMLGEEQYKLEWNPQFASLYSCHMAPKSFAGRAAFVFFEKVIPWIKKRQGKA